MHELTLHELDLNTGATTKHVHPFPSKWSEVQAAHLTTIAKARNTVLGTPKELSAEVGAAMRFRPSPHLFPHHRHLLHHAVLPIDKVEEVAPGIEPLRIEVPDGASL